MNEKMKPVIVLPKEEMLEEDIEHLRENGLCVVECEHPESVRFMEPPPGGYGESERAAIELFRHLMSERKWNINRASLAEMWCDILTKGTSLEPIKNVTARKPE